MEDKEEYDTYLFNSLTSGLVSVIQELIGLMGSKLLLHSSTANLPLSLGISSCLKDGSLCSAANLAACKKKSVGSFFIQFVCHHISLNT